MTYSHSHDNLTTGVIKILQAKNGGQGPDEANKLC